MGPVIYTIGHSTHAIEYFLELLLHHHVTCVVDVRSLAASRFNPQYNRKSLAASLNKNGITYLHFGEEFGARQIDPTLLDDDGRVDFEKVRSSKKFASGVERISKGIKEGYVMALMCSEADPLSCHRFSMISAAIKEYDILHILKDKSVISQDDLEHKLLKAYADKLPKPDIFHTISLETQLRIAYRLLNKSVAYKPADRAKGFRK